MDAKRSWRIIDEATLNVGSQKEHTKRRNNIHISFRKIFLRVDKTFLSFYFAKRPVLILELIFQREKDFLLIQKTYSNKIYLSPPLKEIIYLARETCYTVISENSVNIKQS